MSIEDLLIYFDEMGFAPTVLCPNPDEYACEWKIKLVAEIDRQQAEIKRLQSQVNRLKKYDEERDIALHAKLIKNSKAEAIREFWNRLKAQNTMDERIISVKSGDELIEEMAGKNSYERSE